MEKSVSRLPLHPTQNRIISFAIHIDYFKIFKQFKAIWLQECLAKPNMLFKFVLQSRFANDIEVRILVSENSLHKDIKYRSICYKHDFDVILL